MLRQTAMLKSIKGWRNLAALHANLAIAKSTLIPLAKMGRFLGALHANLAIAKSTLIPLAKMGRFLGALHSSCVIGSKLRPVAPLVARVGSACKCRRPHV